MFTKHQLVIACISTHYEGDPCDNTKKIYKWVRDQKKQKDNTLLKGMKFAVFGLGDTSYEQYNVMGKYFNESFEELGAQRIFKYGEGNAEGNKTEDDFNEWRKTFWKEILDHYISIQTPEEKQVTFEHKKIADETESIKPVVPNQP